MNHEKTLVLGGIRSGKSALAERVAAASGCAVLYIATAGAEDDEMACRIRRHQERRPRNWGLIEEPLALGRVISQQSGESQSPCLLIDCMSLWLSNLLHAGEAVFEHEREQFLSALTAYSGPAIIVSNEVGLGTIAMDPLTRKFADHLGWLNQALGDSCDRVVLTVAGQVLTLKGDSQR